MKNVSRFDLLALRLLLLVLAVVLPGTGCVHIAMLERAAPGVERPAAAVGAALENLRPVHVPGKLCLMALERTSSCDRYRFSFQTYCELTGDYKTVRGEYSRTLRGEQGTAFPLVVISPILGGEKDSYMASRFIARECCRRGMCAFFIYQEKSILSGQRDAFGLEARMRQSVRDNIKALDAFSGLEEIDPEKLASFGVSLGAIRNVALVAAEPRLRANVLCLGGLDLAGILQTSREPMVLRYLSQRKDREDLSAREVVTEFNGHFRSNPKNLVGGIRADTVLMYLAVCDQVVPYCEGLALRQMLGSPEAYLMPLGHYSALIAAPWITASALGWVSRQFASPIRPQGR